MTTAETTIQSHDIHGLIYENKGNVTIINNYPGTPAKPEIPKTQRPAKIFISYKRHRDPDERLALQLCNLLNQVGHTAYLDQNMTIGVNWSAEIKRLIAESDFMVLFLSADAVNSEMVLQEVEYAHEQGKQLLPVRLAYTAVLPYQLSPYLDHLQYALWQSEADTERLLRQLCEAVENVEAWQRQPRAAIEASQEADLHMPKPYADPRTLDAPGGALGVQSAFYVERQTDRSLQGTMRQRNFTVTIRAPRQCGKTSLLIRAMAQAKQAGYTLVHVDFQPLDSAIFETPTTFCYQFARLLVKKLRLNLQTLESFWDKQSTPFANLAEVIENYILPEVATPLLFAFDEVERMLAVPFRDDFFSQVRSWHNERANDFMGDGWSKVSVMLVISTEPHLFIQNANMSPFNVGERLYLMILTKPNCATLTNCIKAP